MQLERVFRARHARAYNAARALEIPRATRPVSAQGVLPPRSFALGVIGLGALGLGAVGLGGCSSVGGYGFESSFAEDVRTVSVPIFVNETSEPGLEIMLTEAVIKEIQSRTPWRVADDAVADTRLEGRIRAANFRRLSRTTGIGLSQEVAFELSVDFDWTRSGSGESLASRQSLEGLGTFVPTRGVDERLEIGQIGAMQATARRIVDEMRASW